MEINEEFENAFVIPISQKAKEILSEIKIVESIKNEILAEVKLLDAAKKASNIKITCPVLGAGKHNTSDYAKRELVKNTIISEGHNAFFLEEITSEETQNFVMNAGFSKTVAKVIAGNEERKNDAILEYCDVIFAVATSEGVFMEIGKCCKTNIEKKLKVLVPNDILRKLSQVSNTLGELDIMYNCVYPYNDDNNLKQIILDIIVIEIIKRLRINNQ